MTGRQQCHCGAQVVEVRIDGSRYLLAWPATEHGDVAAYQTRTGGWEATYSPVGQPVLPPHKRYARHLCEQPPSISEPLHAQGAA